MSTAESVAVALEGVAIIGMAGRFPGARSVEEFWRNQMAGVESISHFQSEELEAPRAEELSGRSEYVRARSVLKDPELFDADFFGMHTREAELTDPQQRIFLECCWQALENGGYDPANYGGAIGVYAGSSPSTYFLSRFCTDPAFLRRYLDGYQVSGYPEMLGNNPDFLATRVAYKLNLRGPSFTIQAGCSTSLIAVAQACQSLLTYQSDMALAGGSSITFPQKRAALYQEGGMISPDGHCRTFDAGAQGTVFGSGAAVVLLKRMDDAVRDHDHIYAVIRGFAVNNDGSSKVGFTAPSVEGQARVIALAHEAAGFDPETIGYIEAHGTATPLGDPIELAALAQAFGARTRRKRFCVIGTAKTNVGHLDIASGVTGLIHAAEIVRHGIFPPTLHFEKPNPKFDLENSPFCVNTTLTKWAGEGPRRAGVSSFGVGGTNVHVVIEQAPDPLPRPPIEEPELIVVSARSETALDRATANLAGFFRENPGVNLADAAWTLTTGRRTFPFRRAVVASKPAEAGAILSESRKPARRAESDPGVCFLFPGQGSQYPAMGKHLYASEPVFREAVDHCARNLKPHLGADLRELLYSPNCVSEEAGRRVTETSIAQPAIFVIEYGLAQLWMHWGIRPRAMLGHSVGEFVAACLAGVFSLEDALSLVAERGLMMNSLPPGGMTSVRMSEADVLPLLNGQLSLAAVNAASLCVVAGPFEALEKLENQLTSEGVAHRRLATSHAFHSAMMDAVIEPLSARAARMNLHAPQIPYISGVTGRWITESEATDPRYWARHCRQPVRFSQGITELEKTASYVLLEAGPGSVLTTLARQHLGVSGKSTVVASLGLTNGRETVSLKQALGELWMAGVNPDWAAVQGGSRRARIPLPTYPFEHKRYWLETATIRDAGAGASCEHSKTEEGVPVNSLTGAVPSHAQPASRKERIAHQVAQMFAELAGEDLSTADPTATFLEMGFDSLFLTQVSQSLQNKFGLKITFRQLLGDLGSLSALADYLDQHLGPDALPEPVATPAATDLREIPRGDGGTNMPESSIERLMREQLQAINQLFAKQLETIGAKFPVGSLPTAEVVPQAVTAPAPQTPAGAPPSQPKEEFKPFGPYKPPQKGATGGMSDRQREALNALIEQYTSRTAASKRQTQENRKHLADPRVVAGFRADWKEIVYPIVAVRSKGSRIWDVDGNEYIDILNGFGPIMLGHRPDFVEHAIERQLHEGFEIGPQTPLAGEIARIFCEMTGNERMTFCNTGSEAVMAALRVARTVTGRSRVVLFSGAYHGMFDEVLVKGFKNKAGAPQAAAVAPGIPKENVGNMTVLDYGTAESLEWIRRNATQLAAVLVEPVQSRHPQLRPADFLREVRKITEESGTAMIIDEVVTGFRVHPGGCQALFGIRADMATYGKVVAGGMPIGILAGKAAYLDALDGGQWQYGDDSYPEVGVTFFAGTFVRHPLTLAAVKAVLEHFLEQGPALQERLTAQTTRMVERINRCFEAGGVPTRLESFGSVFYFSFPPQERYAGLFYYYLRLKGIHVLEGFPCFLTTTHSEADIEQIVAAFKESALEMQSAGFLPSVAMEMGAGQAKPETAREAPLTESQLEVWLSDQLGEEASCSYNESFTLRLRGSLNEESLKTALKRVIARHDALRATFSATGEVQKLAPQVDFEIPSIDFGPLPAAQREARFREVISAEARTAFRLATGPLFRAKLIRMDERETRLVFTSHHIVCDGWSTNVLLDEISRIYNALTRGGEYDLPKAMSFAEYAHSQKQFVETEEGRKVERYWIEQFSNPAVPLDLPLDRPRPSVREFAGATYRAKIGVDTYNRIKKLGAKQNCTLFTTLLSALEILLKRLSGQDDIVIGIPTAGQSLVEDAALVGHCVNFIPLRAAVPGETRAAEFLARMKQIVLTSYEHQNYAYGRLVRNLALKRDPSRLPLTEIQFNLERLATGLEFNGLEAEVDPNPKSFVNFDIFLNIVESNDGLTLDCDYNTGLFDEATIARWLRHYETLLEGMAADVNRPISRLPLLDEEDQRRLFVDSNATEAEYTRDLCVHHLFEAQARRTPDRVAVVCGSHSLTYSQLDRQANRLARRLVNLGAGGGSLTGVYVERSLDMMVGLLAVMKAGGAYVPLDPTYPAERISFVLRDASAPVLITQDHLARGLTGVSSRLLSIDSESVAIEEESGSPLQTSARPDDLAYVIYTSGSTGRPKGVEIPHRAVINLLEAMRRRPGLAEEDTLVAVTTLSFDIAGLELFLPLISGAKLVIASREAAADGNQLLRLLRSSGATTMQATPVTWKLLLEAGWDGNPKLKVLCGGEAFPRELASRLLERASSVWNMYGPTETTIWSAAGEVRANEGPVLLGPPIANTEFYVLDRNGEPAPIGVPGELHIGGDGLARGYFKQPELTGERFIPNPFSSKPGARIYKTGDLVRRLSGGAMEFLGRLDNQVKLRGFRIELGEIEAAVSRYPGVREAAVALREDIPGDKRLVAYVVSDQQALTITPIREFLTGRLPNYMLPSAVVRLDAMPLTPNGKIDRKLLPVPDTGHSSRERQFAAPQTDQEKTLAAIWAEVLHLDQVGVNDDLFELGADSLHIFQIAARAGKMGISVAPAQFLRNRTISSLLSQANTQTAQNGHARPTLPPIVPVSREKYRMPRATA